MKIVKKHIVLFLVLILPLTFFGQVKSIGLPIIKNYKRTEYKGGTQNWKVDQDKKGNLYFANNSGLIQFDGTSWHNYPLPNNSGIRSMKIGDSGKIFVGGINEFGYFRSNDKGELIYYSISKLIPKNEKENINRIWRIHLYKDEVIFQSFSKIFILKNNKLRFINAPTKFQFSFLINNKLYIQDKTLGILEYKNNKLIPLINTTSLNNSEIWAMFPLPNDQMLIATLEKGLFVYDGKTVKSWDTEANLFIKKNSSLGGTIIKNKFIVLNSVLDGIIICDLNGKIIQHLNRNKGLINNTILTSFVDNNNNLWLGLDNGISFINLNSPFTYFDYGYNLGTVYASVVHDNYLYVATNQGLFYHSWNKSFTNEPFYHVEGTISQVWNIQVVNNTLLCASNIGALVIKNNKVIKTLDNKGHLGFKAIPNHENYIIGESYNGFTIFKKTPNGIEFVNKLQGFDETTYTFEMELQDNYLWLKNGEYLYKMIISENLKKIEYIKRYSQISPSYKGIGSIQKINNKIYFQTQNHFYRFSKEQDDFFEDKEMSLLFSKTPPINTLIEDKYKNLWFVFNQSLSVMTRDKNGKYRQKGTPFTNLTGNLVNNYISVNTVDPNNIFIGLTDGLMHYDSKISNGYITKPKAFIKSFSFSDENIIIGNLNQKVEEYNIPYRSNHVKFTFSSPTYENQENVRYSYKLEGFDEQWSKWSAISMKEYTYLKEGSYTMKIKARNSYGIDSDVTEFHFTISPPWYRHFLAYLFYILLIAATIYDIRRRIKMKIRKNKYYETIEQRRLYLEKESKIRQDRYNLEKEIEKLKKEKLKTKILAKDKELVNNTLQIVKKNKILNEINSELKDINLESFNESAKSQFTKLKKRIIDETNKDKSWKGLEKHIKNVHFDFLKRLKEKYPTITPRELDLATYLLMNMSTKEIAEIMGISNGSAELARHRLRKKLNLDIKENLTGFLMNI